jgi:hypothetical protein
MAVHESACRSRESFASRTRSKGATGDGSPDGDERIAREPLKRPRLSAHEIVEYTRSLPRLWDESGAAARQSLVVEIFARLDVLGLKQLEYELTPDVIDLGLDAALPPVVDLGSQIAEFGRGERI